MIAKTLAQNSELPNGQNTLPNTYARRGFTVPRPLKSPVATDMIAAKERF
jgi:hypothetical protein